MVGAVLGQTDLSEELGFGHLAGAFGFAVGLERFELGEVALDVAADAAFIEGEAFEFFGVLEEDGGGIAA